MLLLQNPAHQRHVSQTDVSKPFHEYKKAQTGSVYSTYVEYRDVIFQDTYFDDI